MMCVMKYTQLIFNNLSTEYPRSMEATLENVFSSDQFGADADVGSGSSKEEPCVPQIDQMEVNHPIYLHFMLEQSFS